MKTGNKFFGCLRYVISNCPTIYIVGKHSILKCQCREPTKVERAEVMVEHKKRRTRRSHDGDDKDSPEATVKYMRGFSSYKFI